MRGILEKGLDQVEAFVVGDVGGGFLTAFPALGILYAELDHVFAPRGTTYMRYICLHDSRSDSGADGKGGNGHVCLQAGDRISRGHHLDSYCSQQSLVRSSSKIWRRQ
jgi:hypothetical protein